METVYRSQTIYPKIKNSLDQEKERIEVIGPTITRLSESTAVN
jgi:hypothetical protein